MSRKEADTGKTRKTKAKSRKLATTPRGKVRAMLSQIFLRSRERTAALKAAGNRCSACDTKFRHKATRNGPECKAQVHHLDGGGIDVVTDLIFTRLLCAPDRLQPLCAPCHEAETRLSGARIREKIA